MIKLIQTILLLTLLNFTKAQISGVVFKDINGNGTKQNSNPIELGIENAIVNLYDASNTLIGTSTTDANGVYSIAIANGTNVRVEFLSPTNKPFLKSTGSGGSYGSSVQFVSAPASGINAAFASPDDYINSSDVFLFAPINWGPSAPLASASPTAGRGALLLFKESYAGQATTPDTMATNAQIGTTWGVTYHKTSNKIFTATLFRKYAGYGPGGQSAIYSIAPGADNNFATQADNVVSTFIQLDNYFGANSTGPDAFANMAFPNGDSMLAGRVAFGDIDMSLDQKTIFALNLHDRKIYRIPLDNMGSTPALGTITSSPAFPNFSTCGSGTGVLRPFGMAVNNDDGKVYVTASCENNTALIYVFVYDPIANTWNNTPIIQYTIPAFTDAPCCYSNWNTTIGYETVAIVSGIDFDNSGNVINIAYHNLKNYRGAASRHVGNLLRFCKNGSSWQIESGGQSCGATGFSTTNGQGPGGGEFFNDKGGDGDEVSIMGATLQIPGRSTFTSTMDDPYLVYTAGILYSDNNTGLQTYKYELVKNVYAYPPPANVFDGKRNPIGDIEYMATNPPIEIGNRVWVDTNGDGIQNANEVGLSGVEVELLDVNGMVIATATTNGNGNYYFTSATGMNGNGVVYGVSIEPNTTYSVRVKGTVNPNNQITGNANTSIATIYYLTRPNINGTGELDWSDNDGVKNVNDYYITTITTGDYGAANHTIDFGFAPFNTLPVKFISFYATKVNNAVNLQFTIAAVTPQSSYVIERSLNGVDFIAISRINGLNNITFNYTDNQPILNGVSYYRIKEIDAANAVNNSVIRKVDWNKSIEIEIFPVPAGNVLSINTNATVLGSAQIIIFDMQGKVALKKQILSLNNITSLDISKLALGTYQLSVISNNNVIAIKEFLKAKQ